MQKRKVVGAILGIAAVSVLGIVGYYRYESARYVKTDDARIASNVVAITPEIPGRILEWRVKEGDLVQAGDILGRQDLGSALTSGALSPQSLGQVASVAAEKAAIKAPIGGQVIQSTAVVGQMTAPGSSLAVLADVDGLYVAANVKEADIAKVRLGQEARIEVDAFAGREFLGRVESIGLATASTFSLLAQASGGGNYTKIVQVVPIKVAIIDRGGARLMIGMNASIRIAVKSAERPAARN
jgi:multidrug resistance efflux pump